MPLEKREPEVQESGFAMMSLGKLIFVGLFVILLIGFFWMYTKYQNAEKQIVSILETKGGQQEEMDEDKILEVVEKVKRLIVITEEMIPALATIKDVDMLAQQQSFFNGASNGDMVLIYPNRVIIYNPIEDKLVNVGPVYRNQEQTSEEQQVVEEEEVVYEETTPEPESEETEEVVEEVVEENLDEETE
jgi:hypothetical protein